MDPRPAIDPALERKLAAGMHLAGLVAGPLAPLAAALVWGKPASPWFRRHLRDAGLHWGIWALLLFAAVALDSMNPVYDFGVVAAATYNTLGITKLYVPIAWGVSAVFAVLSARRAARGQSSFYPFTLWWSHGPAAQPVEALELENGEDNGSAPEDGGDSGAGGR